MPLLTLGFGLSIREAAAVSLVSVIVTSSAAASVYLQRHAANLRLGMTLELFTAMGALLGGLVAFALSDRFLAALFAVLLLYTAFTMARRRAPTPAPAAVQSAEAAAADPAVAVPPLVAPDASGETVTPTATTGAMAEEPSPASARRRGIVSGATLESLSGPGYHVHNLGRGIVGAFFAGIVSAVLGVGGGIVKVPVMNLAMGVPLRIATATSNLMIGVTATASAIIYLVRGGLDPFVAGPIAVGVFVGASIGSRVAPRVDVRLLRLLFVAVLLYTAFEMILRALAL